MTPSDFDGFCDIVVAFAELKGKSLSQPALKLYWAAMQSWTLEEFQAAAAHLVTTCQFMPNPADFENLRKAGRQTAAEAWAEVLHFARYEYSPNRVRTKRFSPEVERALQSIGGISAIAMSEVDKTHFLEKRFHDNFEVMRESSDTRDAVPQVTRQSGPTSIGSVMRKLGGDKP
jgi:hypothetical protein